MNLHDPTEVFQNSASNYVKTATRRTLHSHRWYRGAFQDISQHIPGKFSLVPFQNEGLVNPLYHMVCNDKGLPLSIVTKSYALIDHCDAVDSLARALLALDRQINTYPSEVYIGDGGAKFSLRIVLADIVSDPGDGHPVAGRLQVLNSVDRTIPFRLEMGHFRLICSNGLKVFEKTFDLFELHLNGRLNQVRINAAVAGGLAQLQEKSEAFKIMLATKLPEGFSEDLLSRVKRAWGQSEAREIGSALQGGIYRGARVPGVDLPVANLWQVYNILTWVSGRSRNLAAQLKTSDAAHKILAEALAEYRISLN